MSDWFDQFIGWMMLTLGIITLVCLMESKPNRLNTAKDYYPVDLASP